MQIIYSPYCLKKKQENTPAVSNQNNQQEGPAASTVTEREMKVTVEKELVSQAEEDDMEALLGTYVHFIVFVMTLNNLCFI